uniref:Retrotransposon gag domain-containing protein n=1 Tax=Cacopsylla melanoneura TaxID=428564 RepID=A0A8D8XPM3_9HEMI
MSVHDEAIILPYHLTTADLIFLEVDELNFEIKCRDGICDGNVTEKRNYLRTLMREVRLGQRDLDDDRVLFSGEEQEATLQVIQTLCTQSRESAGAIGSREHLRVRGRLNHYIHRINTWPEQDATRRQLKQDTLNLIRSALDDMDDKSPMHDNEVKTAPNQAAGPSTVNSQLDEQIGNRNRPLPPSEFPAQVHYEHLNSSSTIFDDYPEPRVSQPTSPRLSRQDPKIHQWNLQFNGSNMALDDFLDEVELKRTSRQLTWEDVHNCAGDLFTGEAKLWFMSRRTEFRSWFHLSSELRRAFGPPNYDLNLLEELMTRRQATNESSVSYLAQMRIMFGRLPIPMPMEQQLRLIIKNSRYQEALNFRSILTYCQLERALKGLESCRDSPPSPNHSEVSLPSQGFNQNGGYRGRYNNRRNRNFGWRNRNSGWQSGQRQQQLPPPLLALEGSPTNFGYPPPTVPQFSPNYPPPSSPKPHASASPAQYPPQQHGSSVQYSPPERTPTHNQSGNGSSRGRAKW